MNKRILFLAIIISIVIPQYTVTMDKSSRAKANEEREIAEREIPKAKSWLEEAEHELKKLYKKMALLNQRRKKLRRKRFLRQKKALKTKIEQTKQYITKVRPFILAMEQTYEKMKLMCSLHEAIDEADIANEDNSQRATFEELDDTRNANEGAAASAAPTVNTGELIVVRRQCNKCHVRDDTQRLSQCSRCQNVYYCSQDCQRADWQNHKLTCRRENL